MGTVHHSEVSDLPVQLAQLPAVIQQPHSLVSCAEVASDRSVPQPRCQHPAVCKLLAHVSLQRADWIDLNLQLPCGQHQLLLQLQSSPKLYPGAQAGQRLSCKAAAVQAAQTPLAEPSSRAALLAAVSAASASSKTLMSQAVAAALGRAGRLAGSGLVWQSHCICCCSLCRRLASLST